MTIIKDWIERWIEQFGTKKKENDDVILITKDYYNDDKNIYEGHFLDAPEEMHSYKIIEKSRIINSSNPHRINAYVFSVDTGKYNV